MLQSSLYRSISVLFALGVAPAIAGGANFAQLTLARGFDRAAAVVSGHTGGAYSLASIANSDRNNNPCIGYGDPDPDHVMVLKNNFSELKLQVNSGGKDTTIVVKGPRNTLRCGFSAGSGRDASVEDQNWQAGTYSIWVGSIKPSQHWDYRLSAQ